MKNPSQYHIQKRKDGRYVVTVMFNGQRQVIYGRTKKETYEKLTKAVKEIQYAKIHNLQNFSAATTTLSDWATECVETYSKEYVRGSTYYSYKNIIKSHLGDLGNKRLADITNLMVQSHLLSLRNLATGEKLSPKMLINVRNFISLIFNYAIQNRILNHNPVQGVKLPKQVKRPTPSLTIEQQKRLETAVRECDRTLMFAVILDLYTGLRKGELLGFQWKDIDFDKGCISVTKQLTRHYSKDDYSHPSVLDIAPPKTEASVRHVYIIDALKLELLAYKDKMIAWKEEHGFQHSEGYLYLFDKLELVSLNNPIGMHTIIKHFSLLWYLPYGIKRICKISYRHKGHHPSQYHNANQPFNSQYRSYYVPNKKWNKSQNNSGSEAQNYKSVFAYFCITIYKIGTLLQIFPNSFFHFLGIEHGMNKLMYICQNLPYYQCYYSNDKEFFVNF